MNDREIARAIALARTLIGGFGALFPKTSVRLFLGEPAPSAASTLLMRGLGMRDAILGAGALTALEGDGKRDGSPARWVEAGAVADAGDALAAVLAGRLPASRRFLWIATAGGAAYLGSRAAGTLD